jgi:hypothetical protein
MLQQAYHTLAESLGSSAVIKIRHYHQTNSMWL